MKRSNRNRLMRAKGQTLVMALFVLGVLLVLGFVFIGVVNQNIIRSGVAQSRSAASDLAEAGLRYAHNQLLHSQQGADFRLNSAGPISARDPDAQFLQLDPDANPLNGDQGGPDGLGSYTRVNFSNGRALVRIRYAPSDDFLFANNPGGPLRQPGRARSYLIVESIGKVGRVNANDPTSLLGNERRETRKLIAFASIGMLESAHFIHNKDRVNRPAEIGYPRPLGVQYPPGNDVNVTQVMGALVQTPNMGAAGNAAAAGGGSLFSNADLVIHGNVQANLNYTLGDGILVNGRIYGVDDTASLTINRAAFTGGAWNTASTTLFNNTSPSLDSRNNLYTTVNGVLRDEFTGADAFGFVRSVQRKDPPLISLTDPSTGRTRYEILARESGVIGAAGNNGRFGHGRNVFVNNPGDRQMRSDEAGREEVGTSESLIYDWFNPNNDQAGSGWQGPYYMPRAAYVQLTNDGFIIQRDARAEGNERTWRRPDGSNTGSATIRYRIGDPDGNGPRRKPYIINSYTAGVNINDPNPNFSLGQPFDGVVYFEGNVRIRGTIPTDIPLTIVSNATIYVEGSITKGIVGNNWTAFDPVAADRTDFGLRITRPSRSMAILMARDYIAVNTTMFFGPSVSTALEEVSEAPGAVAFNPIRVREAGGTLNLRFEQLLNSEDTAANPLNPGSWNLYAWGPGASGGYQEFGNAGGGNSFIEQQLILSHAMDDGPAPFTFMSLDVNVGIGNAANPSTYLFPMAPVFPYNSASGLGPYVPGYVTPGYTTADYIPMYGLGSESWQRYPKMESVGFSLVSQNGTSFTYPTLNLNAPQGRFQFLAQETNDLTFRHNNVAAGSTNDWLLARAAVVPHDIRIEAALYAEDGSFVVIPGNWFNPNPNDTRGSYEARINTLIGGGMGPGQAQAAANQERREAYGAHPVMPFYGEPLDVRIQIIGSITENMPLPIAQRGEWLKKWGWIGRDLAATQRLLPAQHVPAGFNITNAGADRYVPNLYLIHDPALSTGRTAGYDLPVGSETSKYVRRDDFGRPLPPLPRLPVSPTLSYFGEVTP